MLVRFLMAVTKHLTESNLKEEDSDNSPAEYSLPWQRRCRHRTKTVHGAYIAKDQEAEKGVLALC